MTRPHPDAVPVPPVSPDAVEAVARARYERWDSHYSMPGGLSWEQYRAEDPNAASALYLEDAQADLEVAAPYITADAVAAERKRAVRRIKDRIATITRGLDWRQPAQWRRLTKYGQGCVHGLDHARHMVEDKPHPADT